MDQSLNNALPAVPSTHVEKPILLNPALLRTNPEIVAKERQFNTLADGAMGMLLGATAAYVFTSKHANRTNGLLISTAIGGVIGAAVGHFSKTHEENYSEIFRDAAHAPDFLGHVKKEMKRREQMAFVEGMLIGAPFVW